MNNCNLDLVIVGQHLANDLILCKIAPVSREMEYGINMKEFGVVCEILGND
jgi:hypothetical protein